MDDALHTFEIYVELKEGFKPILVNELETEIRLYIKAKNRATADRAVKKMFENAENVQDWSVICID